MSDTYRCGVCGNLIVNGLGHSCAPPRFNYAPNPQPLPSDGAKILSFLTEDDVRRIVREELARAAPKSDAALRRLSESSREMGEEP